MTHFSEFVKEQIPEVAELKRRTVDRVRAAQASLPSTISILLTGSVARGDARVGPFGTYADIMLVGPDLSGFDVGAVFGPDEEPELPFHCVLLDPDFGIAFQTSTLVELERRATSSDPAAFALCESEIIQDPGDAVAELIRQLQAIPIDRAKERSLQHFYRHGYLIGEYRYEKWANRGAWPQIAQLHNEANECFLSFLHCIQGTYVPRKDWLVYLSYELSEKPDGFADIVTELYTRHSLDEDIAMRKGQLHVRLQEWMRGYAVSRGWIPSDES